jgi:hypothetical protein
LHEHTCRTRLHARLPAVARARPGDGGGRRQDIAALVGAPLNRETTAALTARIEQEQPDRVAAVRAIAQPNGRSRLVLVTARISDALSIISMRR